MGFSVTLQSFNDFSDGFYEERPVKDDVLDFEAMMDEKRFLRQFYAFNASVYFIFDG